MPVKTIAWEGGADGTFVLIDQTRLPLEEVYIRPESPEAVWECIKQLRVRGAPAIGMAGAFGLYLGLRNIQGDWNHFWQEAQRLAAYLGGARPTAVNLTWALRRMLKAMETTAPDPEAAKAKLLHEAQRLIEEDNAVCLAIGEHGLPLLTDGMGILTHCNAGGLGTAQWGTALAPIFLGHERGMRFHVYADETRPLLQGARLTAWELQQAGVPVTLICDNTAATVMQRGWVQAVIVGTDRVAANGDVANKIGTYGVAVLARAHNIPFYVAAPRSSIDLQLATGAEIPIEERDAYEVTSLGGRRVAPEGVDVFNPAFDVTPAEYVTAIITEVGILRPPYTRALAQACALPPVEPSAQPARDNAAGRHARE